MEQENNENKNAGYVIMNVPNMLTLARVVLIPVFIVLFFVKFPWHSIIATVVFILACITDFLDGFIARKQNIITNFGKFLDPIADKMLVASALVAVCIQAPLVQPADTYSIFVAVFAMLIISRELLVSGFRIVAANRGLILAADIFGKLKTVLQMCALTALMLSYDIFERHAFTGEVFYYLGFTLLAAATLMAIVSAVNYIVKNKQVLEG